MIETGLEYYRRRQEQEASLEATATLPEVASVHGELASFYAEQVRRLLRCGGRLRIVSSRSPRVNGVG